MFIVYPLLYLACIKTVTIVFHCQLQHVIAAPSDMKTIPPTSYSYTYIFPYEVCPNQKLKLLF